MILGINFCYKVTQNSKLTQHFLIRFMIISRNYQKNTIYIILFTVLDELEEFWLKKPENRKDLLKNKKWLIFLKFFF